MTVDKTPEANAIATIVADRCHGTRKPNQASQRYAVIWQAARLGAIEAMKQPAPAMAGIPDPAAYVAAFEAMVEALGDAVEIIDDQLGGDFPDSLMAFSTALQAARIARGDA